MQNKTEQWLNDLGKRLFKQYWGLDLDIPIIINPRMYRWTARYNYNYIRNFDGKVIDRVGRNIEFSEFVIENYHTLGLLDLLKHELCHHACVKLNKPFRDGSKFFESELKRIDACSHDDSWEKLIERGYVPRKK